MMIVILGVLAAIVFPVYRDHQYEARASTMAQVVKTVRSRVKAYRAANGTYPPAIDDTLFDRPLTNVWGTEANERTIWVSNLPLNLYPSQKTVTSSTANAMWYNRANGSFCVKVAPQASNAETLELFNLVNDAPVTAMGQTR